MDKAFLVFIITICIIFGNINCCYRNENITEIKEISAAYWGKRNELRKDSVLLISIFRETNKFLIYSVILVKRPYVVILGLEDEYQKVDYNSIFNNKGQYVSRDYRELLDMGTITIKENKQLEDLPDVLFYIKKKNDTFNLIKIPSTEYYRAIKGKIGDKVIKSVSGEAGLINEVVDSILSKK